MRGGIDPGDHHFRPRCIGVADAWKDYAGWEPIIFHLHWMLEAPQTLANQQPVSGVRVGVSTPRGAVSTLGTQVSVPDVLELYS